MKSDNEEGQTSNLAVVVQTPPVVMEEGESSTSRGQETAVGFSTAGPEIQPPLPLDYLKISIVVANMFILAAPGFIILFVKNGTNLAMRVRALISFTCLTMAWFSFPRHELAVPSSEERISGIYFESQMRRSLNDRVILASWVGLARAGVVISWWLALNMIAKIGRETILGSPLWKWSLLAFTLVSAYFAALLICLIIFFLVEHITIYLRKQTNLYVSIALFPNIVLVCYFVLILLAWVTYFKTERGLKQASIHHHIAFHRVTSICITLVVASLVWIGKTCFVLKWSARIIYRRYEGRILMATVRFVYLGLICGKFFMPIAFGKMELLEHTNKWESENHSLQNYIMSKHVDTRFLYRVSQYLTSLAQTVKPLQDDGLSKISNHFIEKITATSDICPESDLVQMIDCKGLSNSELGRWNHGLLYPFIPTRVQNPIADPEDYRKRIAKVLHCLVREQCLSTPQSQYTYDDLKRWLVDAHLNCVNMGRTLTDASTIVTRLDTTISFFICLMGIVLYLLISEIATVKILLTAFSPLLALTLFFGDSAKLFFQGIMFCFGSHSFDVGDRCILENIELEVEKISILTTTFIKIGTKERMMYPNSVLATKPILNKGREPDPSDTVELTLNVSTLPSQWEALEVKLESFFKADKHKGVFQSSHEVTMEETKNKIKVTIHFKHVLNVKEMTHGQCLQKKKRQRPIILKSLSHFLDLKPGGGRKAKNLISSPASPVDPSSNPDNKDLYGSVK